jgi:hypothetical protein
MNEPHIYYLFRGEVIDCGPREGLIGFWHIDWTEHHYFFARPTLLPL